MLKYKYTILLTTMSRIADNQIFPIWLQQEPGVDTVKSSGILSRNKYFCEYKIIMDIKKTSKLMRQSNLWRFRRFPFKSVYTNGKVKSVLPQKGPILKGIGIL